MSGSVTYREMLLPEERAKVCGTILRALPAWFGHEESIAAYVEQSKRLEAFLAEEGGEPVGFVALKPQTPWAHELCVMGVLSPYHRQGIGAKLVRLSAERARKKGAKYLTVKTVADLSPDEGYARTRAFYRALGFVPLEVFPTLWDEKNPCLYSVMAL